MAFSGKAAHDATHTPELTDDVSDLVGLIAPFDTPLLDAIGSPRLAATSTRHNWFEGNEHPRKVRENFTHIFTEGVSLTATMDAVGQHAIEREYDYQVIQRLRELLRSLEQVVINGCVGHSAARNTLGVLDFATTALDANGELLTEAMLNAALEKAKDYAPNAIVCGGFQKRKISSFIQATRKYESETTALRNMVDVYESDVGVQRVILSRWVPADKVLLLNLDKLQVMPLAGRSFFVKPLTTSPEFRKAQIVGEYTLECVGTPHVITGLSTESARV
ncbi:MAG: DUF5309 family protein [Planctomycetes bacterium]|nr:DUF5309 family protein [Planctomycetota bacterium]